MKWFSFHHKKKNIGAGTLAKFFSPTRPQVRRVISRSHRTQFTNIAHREDIDQYFHNDVAQDIAHTQIQKASRSGLRRPIRPIRLVIWSGWGVGMALFAGSLLANVPFPLGALVLRALPGDDRVGAITVTAPDTLKPEQEFTADIALNDLLDISIRGATATLSFNPQSLEVTSVDTDDTNFSRYEDASYDNAKGRVHIVAEEKNGVLKDSLSIAHVHFKVKSYVKETALEIIPQSYVYLANGETRVPERLSRVDIKILPLQTQEKTLTAKVKTEPVTLDGEFSDWRDVVTYDAASFVTKGIQITKDNLIDGIVTSDADAQASFEVAERDNTVYVAWFAEDDEVIDGDTVTLVMNDQVVEVPITKALTSLWQEAGNQARAKKVDGGYNLEIAIPRDGVTPDRGLSLNAEIEDIDSQDSARLRLYFDGAS